MTESDRVLTAGDVLRRYKDEELPAFAGIELKDANQAGLFGERPLDVAAVRGDMAEIAALVEAGADVNGAGELGNTPLHEAVSQGHRSAVEYLLDHGALPDKKNEFGESPLDIARTKERADIARALEAVAQRQGRQK